MSVDEKDKKSKNWFHLVCRYDTSSFNALKNLHMLVMGYLDTNSGTGSLESLN